MLATIISITIILLLFIIAFVIIFKNPIYGLFLLAFLLPFERIPSYKLPFQWGITIRLSDIVALATILVVIVKILGKKIKFKMNIQDYLFLLYAFIAGLSIFVATNKTRSFLVWAFTLFMIIVYWIITLILDNKKQINKIERILFWSTIIVTIFGLYQFIGDTLGLPIWLTGLRSMYTKSIFGFSRIQSTALEPLFFANFLLIPLCLFICKAIAGQSILSKRKLSLVLFLITVTFTLTLSRGAFAAGIVAVILCFALSYKSFNFKRWTKVGFTLLLGILAAYAFVYISVWYQGTPAKAKNFSAQTVNIENGISVTDRAFFRTKAWEGFLTHPVLGVGVGNFGPWASGSSKQIPPSGWGTVNNEPLEILVETGILGFLALMSAFLYLLWRSYLAYRKVDSEMRPWLLGCSIALIAIAIQYQTFSTLYIIYLWVLIGLLAGIQGLILKDKRIN